MSSGDIQISDQIDDPESGWTWFISLASMVVLTVTVVAVAVLFFAFEDNEIESKFIDVPSQQMVELRDEQKALLGQYQRYSVIPMGGTEADAEDRIRIPIDQAMEVSVAESQAGNASRSSAESTDDSGSTLARAGHEEVEQR